jgi:CBS-domain-containing membrane protein
VRGVAEGYNPSETKVGDIMSTDLAYCFEDEEIEEALSLMEARQIRRLPVLSREKRLVGIVSLGDLAVHAGKKSASVRRSRKFRSLLFLDDKVSAARF